MPTRPLILLCAVVVLVGAAGIVADAKSPGNAKAMVLALGDLPSGFRSAGGYWVSNAELTATSSTHKDFQKLGRVTGYNASFTTTGTAGLTEVEAFASIYRSRSGAHASLLQTIAAAQRENGSSIRQLVGPGSLGNDALLYQMKSSTPKLARYSVAWRHGAVFAEVIGDGVNGTINPSDVVALAKKQDRRIATALKLA